MLQGYWGVKDPQRPRLYGSRELTARKGPRDTSAHAMSADALATFAAAMFSILKPIGADRDSPTYHSDFRSSAAVDDVQRSSGRLRR
jgi:hypothetical protein